MRELLLIFQEVEDPRRGNAKRHDLHEMLLIALLATLTGGRACVEMEDYGCAAERWLRTFLALKNGIPSHDAFSRLFGLLDPASLQKALLRLAQDWADRLGDVVAVDGKVLRRSFEDASERSPTHLLQAFAAKSKLTLAQLERGDGAGLRGALGDGAGKWRLTVSSDGQVEAMSLLESPSGRLANLSAPPG